MGFNRWSSCWWSDWEWVRRATWLPLICGCLQAQTQTNTPVPLHLLSIPKAELKSETPAPERYEVATASPVSQLVLNLSEPNETDFVLSTSGQTNSNAVVEEMMLSTSDYELDMEIYRRLEEGGYLTRRPPPPDNFFARATESIFEPTPVQVGAFTVSSSILTAIKKKNLLCLLNPIFFNVCW